MTITRIRKFYDSEIAPSLGVIPFFVMTSDSAGSPEELPTVRTDIPGAVDSSALFSAISNYVRQESTTLVASDALPQFDILLTVHADVAATHEMLAVSLISDSNGRVESLHTTTGDAVASMEVGSAVIRDDAAAQTESNAAIISNLAIGTEILLGLNVDATVPNEILSQATMMSGDAAVGLEFMASLIGADSGVQSESLYPVVADMAAIQTENLSAVINFAFAQSEFISGQVISVAIPAESLSQTIVTSDSAANLEFLGETAVVGSAGLNLEALSLFVGDAAPAPESLAGVASDTAAGSEWYASLTGYSGTAAPLEVILTLHGDTGPAAEVLAGLAGDSAAGTETLGLIAVIGNAAGALEVLSSLKADSAIRVEATASVTRDSAGSTEILARQSADAVGATEYTIKVTIDSAALAEIVGLVVKSDSAAPLETTATIVAVSGDGAVQLEVTARMMGDSGVALEFQKYGVGRGDRNEIHSVLVSGLTVITRS